MRATRFVPLVAAVAIALAAVATEVCARGGAQVVGVRPPAVAGQFYPAEAPRLKLALQALIQDALPPRADRPIAIVVPHAGYPYSGQIAADGWRQASGYQYDTVVILGTNHTSAPISRVALYPGNAFQTPLGTVAIDEAIVQALLEADAGCVQDAGMHAKEHSVEVQVPFVQHLFPGAKIVPAVIGQPDLQLCLRFGRALAGVLRGRRALIVASSDLSHYPDARDASVTDRATLEAMAGLDPAGFQAATADRMERRASNLVTCACGEGPIMAAMAAAKELGATRGVVISYANSGDLSIGDPSRVVGYGSLVMTTGAGGRDTAALAKPAVAPAGDPLQPEDRRQLVRFARETIRRILTTDTVPVARTDNPRLQREQGVFVTLRKRGELRGCIGQIVAQAPLGRLTGMMAVQAAFGDPRFEKVRANELKDIEVEVSVLTPLKEVSGAGEVRVGRDGVLLRKDRRSAVFLPQVATEQGWNREQMLDNLCEKAGLSAGCWIRGASLSTFQADVFSEKDFKD